MSNWYLAVRIEGSEPRDGSSHDMDHGFFVHGAMPSNTTALWRAGPEPDLGRYAAHARPRHGKLNVTRMRLARNVR